MRNIEKMKSKKPARKKTDLTRRNRKQVRDLKQSTFNEEIEDGKV